MKRQPPMLSLAGLLWSIVLLAVLGLVVWRKGGQAFSPGELSEKSIPGVVIHGYTSHAAFESECRLCHAPLETTQDVLCLDCHTKVADQIAVRDGIHGNVKEVKACAVCHIEHQGRDFDPGRRALELYDHSLTGFSLVRHQTGYDGLPLKCEACHVLEGGFRMDQEKCAECHGRRDAAFMTIHWQDFGLECYPCHDGRDSLISFDHSEVFPLEGQHISLRCAQCHGLVRPAMLQPDPTHPRSHFAGTPALCQNCHAEPEAHRSLFPQECSECHLSQGWLPAVWEGAAFEHHASTGFSLVNHSLDFAGQAITCTNCHQGPVEDSTAALCSQCHATDGQQPGFMDAHQAQFGSECAQCHDGVDRMHDFDHGWVFPLEGVHLTIACEACHANQVFQGTPQACHECHTEPAIHSGVFGQACQDCHTSQAWTPAFLHVHPFPLEHGSPAQANCQTCHPQSYPEYTCYGCHDHQPEAIQQTHASIDFSQVMLEQCYQCHAEGQVEPEKNSSQPPADQRRN